MTGDDGRSPLPKCFRIQSIAGFCSTRLLLKSRFLKPSLGQGLWLHVAVALSLSKMRVGRYDCINGSDERGMGDA